MAADAPGDASPARPHAVPVSGLLTDLYQLTMVDAYLERDMREEAVFEFFVRRLPENRSFLLAVGLEQLLDYLETLSFSTAEIEWLRSTRRFSPRLTDYLAEFRFRGQVRAVREGSVFFADEPIVQVTASLPEAQLVETRLINLVHYQTLVASKAARCVLAAPDKMLVDFGLRRAHGAEAGLLAARASYVAGFTGTSTVLADREFGIPIFGTMAHSFIQAHASEAEAFEHFARAHPEGSVLLIDTYDTLAAAETVGRLARRLRAAGIVVRAVRLDSGDMPTLSREVRKILDRHECQDVSIFCSGGLDENSLLEYCGAPVDGFGIGTHLDVSADSPYLDCAYKIQEYAGVPRRKRSSGKATWPGRKQVYRRYDAAGAMDRDLIVEANERCDGHALLETVMHNGVRSHPATSLAEIREFASSELARLPVSLRSPSAKADYPVVVSAGIRSLADRLDTAVQ